MKSCMDQNRTTTFKNNEVLDKDKDKDKVEWPALPSNTTQIISS